MASTQPPSRLHLDVDQQINQLPWTFVLVYNICAVLLLL